MRPDALLFDRVRTLSRRNLLIFISKNQLTIRSLSFACSKCSIRRRCKSMQRMFWNWTRPVSSNTSSSASSMYNPAPDIWNEAVRGGLWTITEPERRIRDAKGKRTKWSGKGKRTAVEGESIAETCKKFKENELLLLANSRLGEAPPTKIYVTRAATRQFGGAQGVHRDRQYIRGESLENTTRSGMQNIWTHVQRYTKSIFFLQCSFKLCFVNLNVLEIASKFQSCTISPVELF